MCCLKTDLWKPGFTSGGSGAHQKERPSVRGSSKTLSNFWRAGRSLEGYFPEELIRTTYMNVVWENRDDIIYRCQIFLLCSDRTQSLPACTLGLTCAVVTNGAAVRNTSSTAAYTNDILSDFRIIWNANTVAAGPSHTTKSILWAKYIAAVISLLL